MHADKHIENDCYFEQQVKRAEFDIYLICESVEDAAESAQRFVREAGSSNVFHPTPRLKNYLRRGYVRHITSIEDARKHLLPIFRQQLSDFGVIEKLFAAPFPEGLHPLVIWLHHANKKVMRAVDELRTRFQEVLPEILSQVIAFAEQPGFYDVFILYAHDVPDDDMTGAEKTAKKLGLDSWHELQEAEERGREKTAALKPAGYLRVFDREETVAEVRRIALMEGTTPDFKLVDLVQRVASMDRKLSMAKVHSIDLDTCKQIAERVSQCTQPNRLANGLYQMYSILPDTNAHDPRWKTIARGFGLQFVTSENEPTNGNAVIDSKPAHDRLTPDMAIKLREHHIYFAHNFFSEMVERAAWSVQTQENLSHLFIRLPDAMARSESVIWRTDMWKAAISGHSAFIDETIDQDTINNTLPQFWFREDLGVTVDFGVDIDFEVEKDMKGVTGIFLCRVSQFTADDAELEHRVKHKLWERPPSSEIKRKGLLFGVCFEKGNNTIPVWRFLPVIYADEPISESLAPFVAALSFMNHELISKERVLPSRPVRRQAERERRVLPDIHTIYLRRTKAAEARDRMRTEEEIEHAKREYSVQFMVGAHWRKQWYASLGLHKPVYILPYFKGDPSLPFKAPGRKIFKVAR